MLLSLALGLLLVPHANAERLECPAHQIAVAVHIEQPVMQKVATLISRLPEGMEENRDGYLISKRFLFDHSAYDMLDAGKNYETCSTFHGEEITVVTAEELQRKKY